MTDSMAHRGPDGSGLEVFDGSLPAGLGHRRLAIIDPSPAGAQPMSFGERWWITYNGELYNFRELRSDLERSGERFRTNCDTEVLLRLFALEGPSMLDRLNGIYAFAVWDDEQQRLFIARDRLGVKPLYYVRQNGVFAFASELRALLPFVGRPTVDPTAVADYFTFLWVPDPRTAFAEIAKLPPGHFAWVDGDKLSVERFWDLSFEPEERSEDEWSAEVRRCVTESVRRQMVSDVPLGSFLSGGVDSSAIVAAMASDDATVRTYTVGFDEKDLRHDVVPDDLRYARRVGQLFRTDYHEEIMRPNVLELLPKIVWHLEEPVADPAAISSYLICREAGKEMPVMLSGMGADEIFAGYPRYLAYVLSRRLDALPSPVRRALEGMAGSVARPGRPGRLRATRRNLWKFMRAAGLPPAERYLSFASYYSRAELGAVLAPDLARLVADYDPFELHRRHLSCGVDELDGLIHRDVKTFLPCLNLTYTDKMGMASSVEVRVPLLDDELVALSARVPASLKLNGLRRKYVFKRSQEGLLPHDVVWRKKAGFTAPVRAWLEDDIAPLANELLSSETITARGLVRREEVSRMRAENSAGVADHSLRLYALISLELWLQTFVDRTWRFEDLGSSRYNTNAAA
jgi:asparagine synthase (glutamine-hydrolysing)